MPRYLFYAAYDGTDYEGWQTQPHNNTVQDHIEAALHKLTRQKVRIYGSGRTDTGVHAEHQPFHFDLINECDPEDLAYRLNKLLAGDIAIKGGQEVPGDFHARFDAVYRQYRYQITTVKDPLRRHYSSYIPYALDIELMRWGLEEMKGQRDFRHFCIYDEGRDSSICNLQFTELQQTDEHRWILRFGADRFMRQMVRYLTGTLIDLARGKLETETFLTLLTGQSKHPNPAPCAAPKGLILEQVRYRE